MIIKKEKHCYLIHVLNKMAVKLPGIRIQLRHGVWVIQQFFKTITKLHISVQSEKNTITKWHVCYIWVFLCYATLYFHLFVQMHHDCFLKGSSYFSTTVPISMQLFSAASRNAGSGWATLTKSACERREKQVGLQVTQEPHSDSIKES